MNNHPDHLDYDDFEAIVRRAHMERSVAMGNAIAGLIVVTVSGLRRAIDAFKSGAGRSKARAGADADSTLDVPAHR